MTTVVHRTEAHEILDACEIHRRVWGSPYNRVQAEVSLATLVERFLIFPPCVQVLLERYNGDGDDLNALRKVLQRKTHYFDNDARTNDLLEISFAVLHAWLMRGTFISKLMGKLADGGAG